MKSLCIQDRCLTASMIATVNRLSLLDEIWTSYLQQTVTIPKRDVDQLARLTAEMCALLSEVKHQARLLKKPLANLEMDWDKLFEKEMTHARISPRMKNRVVASVKENGGMRAVTLKALNEMDKKAIHEQKELQRKMKIIQAGRYVPGDIRILCVLDAALMGTGLAIAGLGGGIVFAAALGLSVANGCWNQSIF